MPGQSRSTRPAPAVLRVSSENSLFQHLEVLLRNRAKRHRAGEFVVEGVQAINLARAKRWTFNALVYAAGRPLSGWGQEVLAGAPGAARVEMAPHLLARLSERDETSELLAVLATPPDDPARIVLHDPALALVFDRPVSPGNLGQIVRSADALGADGLLVTGHGADLYDPQAVRASRGSLFALPAVRLASPRDVAAWQAGAPRAAGGRLQLVGGSGAAATALDEVDLRRPTLLVLGNETHGLSRAYRDLCDVLVRIPMSGAADSLNVASAASIMLYEAGRQRRSGAAAPEAPPGPPGGP